MKKYLQNFILSCGGPVKSTKTKGNDKITQEDYAMLRKDGEKTTLPCLCIFYRTIFTWTEDLQKYNVVGDEYKCITARGKFAGSELQLPRSSMSFTPFTSRLNHYDICLSHSMKDLDVSNCVLNARYIL